MNVVSKSNHGLNILNQLSFPKLIEYSKNLEFLNNLSITPNNRLSISCFNINDPFIRLSRLYYEQKIMYFNRYVEFVNIFGRKLIDNVIEYNYLDDKNKSEIVNSTMKDYEEFEEFCKNFTCLDESKYEEYNILLNFTIEEIKSEFFNISKSDFDINNYSYISNFQINWENRLKQLNILRNQSSKHIVSSSSSRCILDYITNGFMQIFCQNSNETIECDTDNDYDSKCNTEYDSETDCEYDNKHFLNETHSDNSNNIEDID
tara:strand:- start:21 stop:803 length:783 start_codon:yes stop_codon:yes gene_type:complete